MTDNLPVEHAEADRRDEGLLERQPYATLATHNPDGSIHAVPLAYIFEDGLFFLVPSSSSKACNLAAWP